MDETAQALGGLLALIDRLRGEGGCPWDQAQTLETLQPYLIDEAYEMLAAINSLDGENLLEELGDLLFQVLTLCRAAEKEQGITLPAIIEAVEEKMIRRHPHVFSQRPVDGVRGVLERWEEIKAEERGEKRSTSAIPDPLLHLPALRRAQRLQEKAAAVGFDWKSVEGVVAKLTEELAEVEAELAQDNRPRQEAELGDLLFSVVNLVRFLGFDAEIALQRMINRWVRRFQQMERLVHTTNRDLAKTPLEELEEFWQAAKKLPPSD